MSQKENLYPLIWLLQGLTDAIYFAKKNYYNGFQTVSDEAYDAMENELRKLLPTHPLLSCVGIPSQEMNIGRSGIEALLKAKKADEEEEVDIFS